MSSGIWIPHFGLDRQYKNLNSELIEATQASLSGGNWNEGIFSERFSDWLQQKTKTNHAILCHSGTQALEIIAKYEIQKGKRTRIRVPNLTYPATANAFLTSGLHVDLGDCDTHGIMVADDSVLSCYVGLYGAPTHAVNKLSDDYVDGAQHWLIVNGHVGAGMAISFDPTKNLPASGNGGALVTNDSKLANFARSYVNNGKCPGSDFNFPGTNSKMSEQDCAQILVRTNYIDRWQERRKQIREYYINVFKNIHEDLYCLSSGFQEHADQKFVLRTYGHRDGLYDYLLGHGVEAKIHYPRVISELGIGMLCINKPELMLSASYTLSKSVLSLPIYPELNDTEVEYIASLVVKYFTLLA